MAGQLASRCQLTLHGPAHGRNVRGQLAPVASGSIHRLPAVLSSVNRRRSAPVQLPMGCVMRLRDGQYAAGPSQVHARSTSGTSQVIDPSLSWTAVRGPVASHVPPSCRVSCANVPEAGCRRSQDRVRIAMRPAHAFWPGLQPHDGTRSAIRSWRPHRPSPAAWHRREAHRCPPEPRSALTRGCCARQRRP
jgi:hypothetical protein